MNLYGYALSKGAAKRCFGQQGNNIPDLLVGALLYLVK